MLFNKWLIIYLQIKIKQICNYSEDLELTKISENILICSALVDFLLKKFDLFWKIWKCCLFLTSNIHFSHMYCILQLGMYNIL